MVTAPSADVSSTGSAIGDTRSARSWSYLASAHRLAHPRHGHGGIGMASLHAHFPVFTSTSFQGTILRKRDSSDRFSVVKGEVKWQWQWQWRYIEDTLRIHRYSLGRKIKQGNIRRDSCMNGFPGCHTCHSQTCSRLSCVAKVPMPATVAFTDSIEATTRCMSTGRIHVSFRKDEIVGSSPRISMLLIESITATPQHSTTCANARQCFQSESCEMRLIEFSRLGA
jgi:hypothetical protein